MTDAVLDEVAILQQRPLDPVYPLVFFDALRLKIRDEAMVRNRAIHVALGIRADGAEEVPGLWLEQNEAAKFWLRAMNELGNCGTKDILRAGADGSKGFPEAIAAVFPDAMVQTCIVHLLRNSMDFVSWKDREGLATALKQVYRAPRWPSRRLPRAWAELLPVFAFPDEVRRILYTTDSIGALASKLRQAVRARGHFPSDEARPSCST